jgi:hypothetical protein
MQGRDTSYKPPTWLSNGTGMAGWGNGEERPSNDRDIQRVAGNRDEEEKRTETEESRVKNWRRVIEEWTVENGKHADTPENEELSGTGKDSGQGEG